MGLVITLSGPHGTGKTTYAKAVAKKFKLRYISAGQLFRQIAKEKGMTLEELSEQAANDELIDKLVDDRTRHDAEKGNVVIEGQLAGWVVGDRANVKIRLVSPEDVRIRRIAKRDRMRIAQARKQTVGREDNQRERYKRYYGIDVDDASIYDFTIETDKHSISQTSRLLEKTIKSFLAASRPKQT